MLEYCIRTYHPGRQPFTRSQSFSHHHDHRTRYQYRSRCFDGCAEIPLEKWNSMREQKKDLMERNDVLTRENQALKNDLQASTQENSRLLSHNQQMIEEIEELRRTRNLDAEATERFRRRVQALKLEVEQKDRDLLDLRRNNDTLNKRVGVMTETISALHQRISDKAACSKKRRDDYQKTVDEVTGRLDRARRDLAARLRELDEKDALIDEQCHMLRRYETTIPARRRYSFV
ncbi:uncharacterized protein F4812DRAFT_191471 [Daldinia caldariorum]|uniref:uncharacterized protein n=1 Tax=Daldinia caldariorum TaxID=326644 RepID=UPI0020076AA4|nr:uncharacterized protein F4812DRAFT_191471 [Daldinia caldariorum]KAI1471766.1 hypothetical protein F4812DRAFT_191471 [Daldinia caldariorum]